MSVFVLLCHLSFFIFQVWNFIKNSLQHKWFPVKFEIFLATPSLTEHFLWLHVYDESDQVDLESALNPEK